MAAGLRPDDLVSSIRLVFVTDVHHGHDHLTKKGSTALSLLAELGRVVAEVGAEAVIDLGDRISDTDQASDLRRQAEVAAAFRAVPVPCHHICGNHDLVHLSVADNERALGQSLAPEAVDLGG